VLLVEGADDKGVCVTFLKRAGVAVAVLDKDGYENLRKALPVELQVSECTHLGVVVDADADLGARWESLKTAAAKAGYTLPAKPATDGLVMEGPPGRPRLGVWVMPNNSTDGMLEHFVHFLVPEADALMAHAHAAIDAIPETDRLFAAAHRSKAAIHTWLAWQEEPGRPMGQAITKRYLDGDCAQAAPFLAWIRRLFG
jgi:hypothetical protein